MGFYGNITSVNKSTFQFDKIYPNREEMDSKCDSDGIFIGRYVLIDYDKEIPSTDKLVEEIKNTTLHPAYMIVEPNGAITFHNGSSFTDNFYVYNEHPKEGDYTPSLKRGDLIMVLGKRTITGEKINHDLGYGSETREQAKYTESDFQSMTPEVWKCVGAGEEVTWYKDPKDETKKISCNLAAFEKLAVDYSTPYNGNYSIDYNRYQSGRGYDSTVWQKTYVDGKVRYVMIAELNSVVPTFDISVDAPTETPLKPHYDSDSSNVYYKLHVQPQWGLRLKSAYSTYTTDTNRYPSDTAGSFVIKSYIDDNSRLVKDGLQIKLDSDGKPITDKKGQYELEPVTFRMNKGEVIDDADTSMPLAVYFDKAGFDPYKGSDLVDSLASQGITLPADGGKDQPAAHYDERKSAWEPLDSIAVRPTGISDTTYNFHNSDGSLTLEDNLADTYELSIMLPSIGQSLSEMWDLVYGKNRSTDVNGRALWHPRTGAFASDKDKLSWVRNTNYLWDTHNGLRAVYEGEKQDNGIHTYDKESLNTVVGGINAVHDLMGMIIRDHVNADLSNVDNWDPTRIYYKDGAYFKKHKTYTYTVADSKPEKPGHQVDMIDPSSTEIYRKEDDEFPKFDEDRLHSLAGTLYYDYRRVHNSKEYIEDAQYGTITPGAETEISSVGYEPYKYYYKASNSSTTEFVLDTGDTPAPGRHYIIEGHQQNGYEFYIPNRYWRRNNKTQEIKWCDEATLQGAIGATDSEGSDYTLYRSLKNTITGTGTEGQGLHYVRKIAYEKDGVTPKTVKSYVAVPSSTDKGSYTNQDGVLTILDSAGQKIDEITNAEDIVLDPKTNKPGGYYTKRYQIKTDDSSEVYLSPWDRYISGATWKLDENGQKIPEYQYIYTLDVDENTFAAALKNPVHVKEFVSGDKSKDSVADYAKGFYVKNGDHWIREEASNLKNTTSGIARNSLDENGNIGYWTLTFTEQPIFYDLTENYYYKNAADDWCRETVTKTASRDKITYYEAPTFTPISSNTRIFVPHKYYTDEACTQLAETYSASATYYEPTNIRYVAADTSGIYPVGAIWNEAVTPVPSTVTLGTRVPRYEPQKLEGFAVDLNTIHGLIIKVNNMLLADDHLTRDNTTVQGAINTLNDIIDKFNTLTPSEFVMVDRYGRIHSGDFSTEQGGSYTNVGTKATGTISNEKNRWVKLTTDSGKAPDYKPSFTLQHQLSFTTPDTTTTANKNVIGGNGLNAGQGDTLQLYTPIVDNYGHIIGKNTETVTLPFDYKRVAVGSASMNVGDGPSASAYLVAENTQDTLTISPSNKWIRMQGSGKTLAIGHQVNSIDTAASTATNLNDNSTTTLNIPDFSYDEAGHIISKKNHSYTLPYNFKYVTVGSANTTIAHMDYKAGTIAADSVYDTLTVNSGNKWIDISANSENDTITFAHSAGLSATTVGDESAQTPKFGDTFKALRIGRDQAGHVVEISEHTVKIPLPSLTNGTGNVVTGLSLTPTTGALTETKANIGTLSLIGYNPVTSISGMPTSADSLNTALEKLAYILDNRMESVDSRIRDLDSATAKLGTNQVLTGVTITDGKITAQTSYQLGTIAAKNIGDFEAAGNVDKAIKALNSATASLKTNEVLTGITLENGKVSGQTSLQLGSAALKSETDFDKAGTAKNLVDNLDVSKKEVSFTTEFGTTISATLEDMLKRIIALESKEKEG